MAHRVYETFILTQLQLDILLNRLGYSKLYGIEAQYDEASVYQEQVYLELADMVQKGFIKSKKSKFVMDIRLKGILQNMAEAKSYIHILSNLEEGREYMCYLNKENVIITGLSRIRNNRIAVTKMTLEEFKENILWETLPEEILKKDYYDEKGRYESDYILEKSDEERETKNIELFKAGIINNELMWYCEIVSEEKNYSEDIYVFECMLELYSLVVAENIRVRRRYDREEYFQYVINEITRIKNM